MSGSFGIDPEKDVAGNAGNQCFLCSHPILVDPLFFGKAGPLMPKLPCHPGCLEGKPLVYIEREYTLRIHDFANVSRPH